MNWLARENMGRLAKENIIRLFTCKDLNEVEEPIHIITLSSNVVM